MTEPRDEIDDIILRARAVEDEIEATRGRIEKLLGVGADASLFSRQWKERFVAEVRHDLPAVDVPAAHEALVEAMHRETGLVGAVRRRGEELSWKPFFDHAGTRGLEVHLEGDADAPSLRLRGSATTPGRQAAFVAGAMIVSGGVTAAAVALTRSGLVAGLSSLGAMLLFLLLGARFSRRGAERRIAAVARRVSEQVANAGPRVRVAEPSADADEADDALLFEAAHRKAQREGRRGVS